MSSSQCSHCGAVIPPPAGPVWACPYCHAQFEAPSLPEGYIWLSDESVHALLRSRLTGVAATFLHPSIPAKKIENVRKLHEAHLPADEAILGIYDATVFGSAKDGWVVTSKRLCFKNQIDAPQSLAWTDVKDDQIYVDGNHLLVGRAKLDTLFGREADGLFAWHEVFQTLARSAGGPGQDEVEQASAGAAAALAHAEAWGGPEVLVAAQGAGWGGTGAGRTMGAGVPPGTPRPDFEYAPQAFGMDDRSVSVVDVHPSGELVLAADGGILELRYAQNGQRYHAFPLPGSVLSARFSPDGNWVVVGGTDSRASLFEVRSGQHRGASVEMAAYCDEVAWLGSTSFAMASQRGEVWIVDASTMTVTQKILGPDPKYAHLGGLAVAADGSRAYVSCGNKLGAFDVASGRIVWRVEEALYNPGRLAVSPRGDMLVMAGYDGVAILDASTGQLLSRYQFPSASSVKWSGKRKGGLLDRFVGADEHSWSARPRFSPAGNLVALQDPVGNLCFIDPTTGALHMNARETGRAWIEDIAWFGDSNHLLLGSSDNTIAIWSVHPFACRLHSEGIGLLGDDAYARASYL